MQSKQESVPDRARVRYTRFQPSGTALRSSFRIKLMRCGMMYTEPNYNTNMYVRKRSFECTLTIYR